MYSVFVNLSVPYVTVLRTTCTCVQVMKAAFEQKSPKVQSESLDWLGQAIKAFGFLWV